MQSSFPWALFEMLIAGANKGGPAAGSDAAESQRCDTVHISLKCERQIHVPSDIH